MPIAGMGVQCSIMESRLLSSRESPVKALNGNEIPPVVEARHDLAWKRCHGIRSLLHDDYSLIGLYTSSPYPAPSTTAEAYWRKWRLFTSRQDAYSWDSSAVYTGTCSFDTTSQLPSVSGYPTGIDSSGNQIGAGTGYTFDPHIAPMYNGTFLVSDWSSETSVYINGSSRFPNPGWWELDALTLSGLIDCNGIYTAASAEFELQTLPAFDDPDETLRWHEYYNLTNDVRDITDPEQYTGESYTTTEGVMGAYDSFMPVISGVLLESGAAFKMLRGRARMTTNRRQFYFVGRCQENLASSGWQRRLSLVQTGWVSPVGGVIEKECPYPSVSPVGQTIFDVPVFHDFNFLIIGMDPVLWCYLAGFVRGFADYFAS